jgi:WD40 repeat protein
VHSSVVHCIRVIQNKTDKVEILLSGGKDGRIVLSNAKSMEEIKVIPTPETYARAIDMVDNKVLAGLRNGRIIETDYTVDKRPLVMIYSHHEGEVWGLCELEGENCFITSGDDNKIIRWNVLKRQCAEISKIGTVDTSEKAVKKAKSTKFKGGASTLSSLPPECQSRAVAYEKNSKHLAVAQNNGVVTIRDLKQGIKSVLCSIHPGGKKAEWIECMAYNVSGDKLAVASHDNKIYIY